MAFLAKISTSVVQDHYREGATNTRRGQVIPIESAQAAELRRNKSPDSPESDARLFSSVASWIDIERIVEGEPDRKNAERNALIFKLHFIDGFESGEIAAFPGFGLTTSGVQAILARLRKRIQG
jgi:DNA-directed RNA polymerase specialized sigma24 family protein